jgi:cardiolipin synthase
MDRRPWESQISSASVVGLVVLAVFGHRFAEAGDHASRELAVNAVQPAGATFEGYPAVGHQQKVELAREIVRASISATLHSPIRTVCVGLRRIDVRLVSGIAEKAPVALVAPTHPRCGADDDAVDFDLGEGAGGPSTPARLTLLPNSELAIRALLGQIARAQMRIDLMMYGWEDDPTGREVACALEARARAGVRVRAIVDRTAFLLHNAPAARGQCTFLDGLRATPNVSVVEAAGAFVRFDHRKLAVFDDRVVWSGGMILTEVARRQWQNFAYIAEGPLVAQFVCAFAERWHECTGDNEGPLPVPSTHTPVCPNATVRLLQTDLKEHSLADAVYRAVDNAKLQIYLENPYFSDELLTKKLIAASARGVDVRAILTLRGNMPQMNRFETLTANRLLRGGARVWLYPAMTHVKAMSVDGVWAYIGTGNFDALSLYNNHEVGLSVASPSVVSELDKCLFFPEMQVSQELHALLPPPKKRLKLEVLSVWY